MIDETRSKALTEQAQRELFLRLCQQADAVWNLHRGSADDLRALGLEVAVHNDYRLGAGERFTFWLMTYQAPAPNGVKPAPPVAFKGEGRTDHEALDKIRAAFAKVTDDHHHAPMCAANHYHGTRAPTGRCTCGAVAAGVRMGYRPEGFITGYKPPE